MLVKKSALDLDARRQLYDLIGQFPGLHFREILRRVDMSSSNVSYHLSYLLKNGITVEVADGKLKRYYIKGKVDREEKRILSSLRNEIARGLVLFLLLNPDTIYHDILDHFDLEPSRLSYYLKKLVKAGVLSQTKEGRTNRYTVLAPDKVAKVLISYQPAFLDSLVDSFVEAWLSR